MMRIQILRAREACDHCGCDCHDVGGARLSRPTLRPRVRRLTTRSSSHSDIDRTRIEARRARPRNGGRDVVAHFPNCATLTDGCQSCVPNGDTLTCSNPGIACTRGEMALFPPKKQPN